MKFMINIYTMNQVITQYPQLPHIIEDLIQDMITGPISHWKNQFIPVLSELQFRVHNKLAWQVEMFLMSIPESILRMIHKNTYSYIDEDDEENLLKETTEYRLSWGPDGNGPYTVEVFMGSIQVNGTHAPSVYDQEAIAMVREYGTYCSDNYEYLLDHYTINEFYDFIFSEIGRHKYFWDSITFNN